MWRRRFVMARLRRLLPPTVQAPTPDRVARATIGEGAAHVGKASSEAAIVGAGARRVGSAAALADQICRLEECRESVAVRAPSSVEFRLGELGAAQLDEGEYGVAPT